MDQGTKAEVGFKTLGEKIQSLHDTPRLCAPPRGAMHDNSVASPTISWHHSSPARRLGAASARRLLQLAARGISLFLGGAHRSVWQGGFGSRGTTESTPAWQCNTRRCIRVRLWRGVVSASCRVPPRGVADADAGAYIAVAHALNRDTRVKGQQHAIRRATSLLLYRGT